MNIIEFLKTLEPKTNVRIWLQKDITDSEYKLCEFIADTTAEVLLQSTKEGFRRLEVYKVAKDKTEYSIIVKEPKVER